MQPKAFSGLASGMTSHISFRVPSSTPSEKVGRGLAFQGSGLRARDLRTLRLHRIDRLRLCFEQGNWSEKIGKLQGKALLA